jgi:RNA polymerase sigma factor (sigma-70 family)
MNIRDKTILDNTGLIWAVMNTFTYSIDDEDDIYLEGMIGLIMATDKFDPSLGFKFSTYAYSYIRNKILDFFTDNPYQKSLDEPLQFDDGDDTVTLLDTIPSDDNIEQSLEDDDLFKYRMSVINDMLENIPDQQATAYRMMLSGGSYHDISSAMNVSVSKVKQLIGVVDRRLNQYILEKGIVNV